MNDGRTRFLLTWLALLLAQPVSWAQNLEGPVEWSYRSQAGPGYGSPKSLGTGQTGMVSATSGAPAIVAGRDVLQQGGNACDAALTTALAQIALSAGSVVSYAGIMGMVYYDAASGQVYSLEAGFKSPMAELAPLTIPGPLQPGSTGKPGPRGRSVLVPGFMAGIAAAHRRFGSLPFETLFEPAIDLAENGFSWSPLLSRYFEVRESVLSRRDATRSVFMRPDGEPYRVGDLFVQPGLAATLRQVAAQGAEYMYTGDWAKKLVATVQSEGGALSLEDMAAYRVVWHEPLRVDYHGYEIQLFHEAYVTAAILNLLRAAHLEQMGQYSESPEAFYWYTQIARLVMANGPDNGAAAYSPEDLLGVTTADGIWKLMRAGSVRGVTPPAGTDGANHSDGIVAVDAQGNVAVILHTIYTGVWGGNGLFVDGVSIPDAASLLRQRMASAGPGARLPPRIPPLIVTSQGRPVLAASGVGGSVQLEIPKVVTNVLDFGMTPKAAIDAPRFLTDENRLFGGPTARVRQGEFSPSLIAAVRRLGLELDEVTAESTPGVVGSVTAVTIDPDSGRLLGGVPEEFDGVAAGY